MSSMLSGFTSQLGTLIGSKGSKDKDTTTAPTEVDPGVTGTPPEQIPPNTTTAAAASSIPGLETSVLSSVRNHIPSWLGGSKTGKEEEAAAVSKEGEDAPKPPPASGGISPDKESDASSATGGADSDNQQLSEGEGEGDKGGLEKVKNLGNLLFSTIKGAGQKINKIKETSILGDFQREHDSFLKSKVGKAEAVPPWVGSPKEEALKEEILSLSNDRRNFVRSPPSGVSFTWDWEEMEPVARATLKEDPNLETMRYQLVPKVITEENFWRNYFYRVSLLKESMSEEEPKSGPPVKETVDDDFDDALEKELNEELRSFEVVGSSTAGVDDKEIDALLDLK